MRACQCSAAAEPAPAVPSQWTSEGRVRTLRHTWWQQPSVSVLKRAAAFRSPCDCWYVGAACGDSKLVIGLCVDFMTGKCIGVWVGAVVGLFCGLRLLLRSFEPDLFHLTVMRASFVSIVTLLLLLNNAQCCGSVC